MVSSSSSNYLCRYVFTFLKKHKHQQSNISYSTLQDCKAHRQNCCGGNNFSLQQKFFSILLNVVPNHDLQTENLQEFWKNLLLTQAVAVRSFCKQISPAYLPHYNFAEEAGQLKDPKLTSQSHEEKSISCPCKEISEKRRQHIVQTFQDKWHQDLNPAKYLHACTESHPNELQKEAQCFKQLKSNTYLWMVKVGSNP